MNLCNIREIRPLLERHGFRFSRSMGQNFLIDGQVPLDIAAASGADGGTGLNDIFPQRNGALFRITFHLRSPPRTVIAAAWARPLWFSLRFMACGFPLAFV